MKIDLTTFVNTFFKNKKAWTSISDDDKKRNFFMFNRNMAKAYPLQAQAFNYKGVNEATAMEVWFYALYRELKTPWWFWAGAKTTKKTVDEYTALKDKLKLNDLEILILKNQAPEELEFYAEIYNENTENEWKQEKIKTKTRNTKKNLKQ